MEVGRRWERLRERDKSINTIIGNATYRTPRPPIRMPPYTLLLHILKKQIHSPRSRTPRLLRSRDARRLLHSRDARASSALVTRARGRRSSPGHIWVRAAAPPWPVARPAAPHGQGRSSPTARGGAHRWWPGRSSPWPSAGPRRRRRLLLPAVGGGSSPAGRERAGKLPRWLAIFSLAMLIFFPSDLVHVASLNF
jgi:hypothetical protein